jgi:hypothetical protein
MDLIIKCEVLHTALSKIYSLHSHVLVDTPEYFAFQSSENPESLGFTYERDYEIEVEDSGEVEGDI